MHIEAIDSEKSNWELIKFQLQAGIINRPQVLICNGKNAIPSVKFETRIKERFSLKGRIGEIKPMMGRVAAEYEHKRPDGSSDRIKIEYEPPQRENKHENCSTNNENDNRANDIDSRDRDFDRDNDKGG